MPACLLNDMKSCSASLLLLTVSLAACQVAWADNPPGISPLLNSDARPSDTWQVSASPYAWASGIRGKVGQFGAPPVRLDSSFGKVMSSLDVAFMGAVEARHGRFSILGDVMYGQLSGHGSTPYGLLSKRADVKTKSFTGFLGGGYSMIENEHGHLDVVGGGRLWYASTKLSLDGGVLNGKSRKDSATWVDAVAGLRGRYALNDNWYLTGWGLVGAGQAKLDWDVTGAVGYQFKSKLSAVLGYRAMGVDFKRNGFVYNVVQQGPIVGLAYRF